LSDVHATGTLSQVREVKSVPQLSLSFEMDNERSSAPRCASVVNVSCITC